MKILTNISGFLIDLDGVLYVGSELIDGAIDTVQELKRRGYGCRFITNTSTASIQTLHAKLTSLGLPVEPNELLSAPQAVLLYLKKYADPVCYLVMEDDVKQDFAAIRQSDQKADFIIIGDIGDRWSYALMNRIFSLMIEGASMIAIHKNRFWQTEQGLQLDIGAFVSGLEYATGKEALVIGKPSATFFASALRDLHLTPEQVAIIGDDIDSDIGGGQASGLTGVLVKTGKYRRHYAERSEIKPDCLIDSIADLPIILE